MTTFKRFNGTDWEYIGLPNNVAIAPLTLGYSETFTDTGAMADLAVVPNLKVTITVPEGRRIKVTAHAQVHTSAAAGWIAYARMDGVAFGRFGTYMTDASEYATVSGSAVVTPSAGTHYFDIQVDLFTGSGTTDWNANTGFPMWLLVEDITGSTLPYQPAAVPVGQLGYAEYIGGTQTIGSTGTETDVTNLLVNVVVPAGRTLKITSLVHSRSSVATDVIYTRIREVGIGGNASFTYGNEQSSSPTTPNNVTIVSPTAGMHTYKATVTRGAGGTGSVSVYGAAGEPSFILVEDITPTPAPATGAPSSTLGYAQATTAAPAIGAGPTDVPSLQVTVTVPAGRRLRISGNVPHFWYSDATTTHLIQVYKNGALFGTLEWLDRVVVSESGSLSGYVFDSPSAGTHTYKLVAARSSGSGTILLHAAADEVQTLLVEDITGATLPVGQAGLPSSTLGYSQVTADQTSITTQVPLSGLSVTITVPAGRRLRVTGEAYFQNSSVNSSAGARMFIQGDGNQIQQADQRLTAVNIPEKFILSKIDSPVAGTHTYRLTADNGGGGSVTMVAGAAYPAYILVEDITGVGVPGHTHSGLDDSGWIDAVLQNGWVSYDSTYGPPGYRKIGNVVYLRGLMKNGTATGGITVFTLPAGYRPSLPRYLMTSHSAAGITRTDITDAGLVLTDTGWSASWTSLNGVSFPAG